MGAGAPREPNINQISLIEILPHTFIDKNLSPLITNPNLKISIKWFNRFGKNLIMCAWPAVILSLEVVFVSIQTITTQCDCAVLTAGAC